MSLYSRVILPRLIDLVMGNKAAAAERAKLVPVASGTVLEIGVGSARNVPYYGPDVRAVYGIDPSLELWEIGRHRLGVQPFPVQYLAGSAEQLPVADHSIDTVLSTWTLCSIPDVRSALREIWRVMNPGGRFIFIEHGRAPDARVRRWQDRLTPFWARISAGCHLNRPIDVLIEEAGFSLSTLDREYTSGPKPMAYLYKGVAVAAQSYVQAAR
jgi:ubiquinone/menaquinone biosynthesis C-methylase UbiE